MPITVLKAPPRHYGSPPMKSLLQGLQAYWRLANAQTNDWTGNGNTLTANNTPTTATGPGGRLPYATQFTRASSQDDSLVNNAFIDSGNGTFTVAKWLYIDTVASVLVANLGVLSKGITTTTMEWSTWQWSNNDKLFFSATTDGQWGVTRTNVSSPSALAAATWYFVVNWYDTVAGTLNIQVNDGTAQSAAFGTMYDNNETFRIGRGEVGSYHGGRIAGVSFWNRVLTAAERTYLYANGAGRDLIPGTGFL